MDHPQVKTPQIVWLQTLHQIPFWRRENQWKFSKMNSVESAILTIFRFSQCNESVNRGDALQNQGQFNVVFRILCVVGKQILNNSGRDCVNIWSGHFQIGIQENRSNGLNALQSHNIWFALETLSEQIDWWILDVWYEHHFGWCVQ